MAQHRYTVYFEPAEEGGYNAVFPAIPEICTFGRNLGEARAMASDALRCHLEGLAADGEPFPKEDRAFGEPVKEQLAVTL